MSFRPHTAKRIRALASGALGRIAGAIAPSRPDRSAEAGPGADALVATGRVRIEEYRTADVREQFRGVWNDRAALERELGERFGHEPDPLDAARIRALDRLDPVAVDETTNTQLKVFHENIVDVYDPNQTVSALSASHLALGTDGSSVAYGDTGLTTEVYREGVDSSTDNGNDLKTSTLLDEAEGNGNTFRELGLVSAASGGTFFNHALIEDRAKTSDKTATFEVVLEFRAA